MGEDGEFRTEYWKVQESASPQLAHRGPSARGRHRVIVGLKPTGSHRDQRGRRDDLLRLDVVDFNVFSALQARQVDLVVESVRSLERTNVLQLQNTMMMLRSPVEETKEVGLRHD